MPPNGPMGQLGPARPDNGSGRTLSADQESRPRDEDRLTRKPLAWWARIKILILLLGVWGALLWADIAGNPLLPVSDAFHLAMSNTFRQAILALAGLEVIRQIHYAISEHQSLYHQLGCHNV